MSAIVDPHSEEGAHLARERTKVAAKEVAQAWCQHGMLVAVSYTHLDVYKRQ